MSNSPLAVYTRLSPNRTSPRNHAIDTITIHCYVGQVDRQNLTVHRWFANKACPGDYLYSRLGDIAKQVNAKLEGDTMTGEEIYKELTAYTASLPLPGWAKEELEEAVAMGITDGTDPMGLIPRYQAAIMAKRAVQRGASA